MQQFRDTPYEKILIPIDGSVASMAGIYQAIRVAKQIHTPVLRLLYIADEFYSDEAFEPGTVGWTVTEAARDEGKRILHDAINILATYGLVAKCHILDSHKGKHVANQIVQEAVEWPADMIVMGTHGRRGIARLSLGSSAEQVSRTSPVPVLLVRAGVQDQDARHVEG